MAMAKSAFSSTSHFAFIYFSFVIFFSCLVYSNKASEIRRPRGVSISKASLYIPDQDFTCFDGTITIPFLQVNDDFCDCPDGSDEPGTAACPNGFFHCTNAGFKPLNIPSSLVNDGICDCCDGSDEYVGKVTCSNTCHELGKAERLEQQKLAEITKLGFEAKIQSIKKGKQLKLDKREKLKQLENDKQEAESIKAEKEKLKVLAEELEKDALEKYRIAKEEDENNLRENERKLAEKEAMDIFVMLDSDGNKIISISELRVRHTFDQNRDGVVSDDEAKFFLDNQEEVGWDSFLNIAWPKMKPFFMMEKGLFKPPEKNNDSEQNVELVSEPNDGVGTVEDVTDEYHKERQTPEEDIAVPEQDEEDEEEEEEEEEQEQEQEHGENESKGENSELQYDEDTQKLVNAANDARSEYEEADRAVRDIQRQMTQYQDYLDKDFGAEEEFAPLEGECFEYTDREYVYKLCPFDQASQQPRSGGSETRLGQWNKWVGPEHDKYSIMLYDKGQSCWNGPQRSTYVKLKCGIENIITSVTEPNKCEYHFEFNTPSACKMSKTNEARIHDEL
ncbi:glucosidase 2 subunit beta precursor, putative [Pediculus humanus corporis]|uniref:Glucosidase 2 subunit beta n=1 Tax=Pediculus humanus subsp. corporis TaxID=121224 RepID=E0VQQ4_PEDHC|nr:glucosidase 2 subunit beta precursor, putative [Pediculus humanus corporis]EEB15710.1 glucosidase 2 subunit beta precursor, putative [Pediculus humanus corporis]